MIPDTLALAVEYLLPVVWGLGAVYLVYGITQQCPMRYPFMFGLVSAATWFLLREIPVWFPPSITSDVVLFIAVLIMILFGVEMFRLVIRHYELDTPADSLRRVRDADPDSLREKYEEATDELL